MEREEQFLPLRRDAFRDALEKAEGLGRVERITLKINNAIDAIFFLQPKKSPESRDRRIADKLKRLMQVLRDCHRHRPLQLLHDICNKAILQIRALPEGAARASFEAIFVEFKEACETAPIRGDGGWVKPTRSETPRQ